MTHIMYLSFIAIVIGGIVWWEWTSLDQPSMKAVYLTIIIFVFVMTVVITFYPELPGPLQGIRFVFRPFILPWMSH